MTFNSRYVAHKPDSLGYVDYSQAEHDVWKTLFERQVRLLPNRACQAFIQGIEALSFTSTHIPQLPNVNQVLQALTGWQVKPVEALISARAFFELLAQRKFPAATFIRAADSLDYVQEPDIFHELFGHCPMLTDTVFSRFAERYAQRVLSFPEKDWPLLQRLFWFTVEFGLVYESQGLRSYGGGILSSVTETVYCVESDVPLRVLFSPVAALRTPYRVDKLQQVYFVLNDFNQLYDLVDADLSLYVKRARELGELPALFEIPTLDENIHIFAC